ncbi:hypothetical protein ACO0RG_000256 [Hanseniaspora osmophila]|uniref:Uncharacterized protein n=1 Tax=Hanseniaspora osmophila TaxID=56408 RepID=A0A1E5R550_9ASCO|nr:hypothetical protein AWRI3579_g3731 [Hanseniaspora osmophila]
MLVTGTTNEYSQLDNIERSKSSCRSNNFEMDEEQLLWCKISKQVDAISNEENIAINDTFKNSLNELTKEKLKQIGNDLQLFMRHRIQDPSKQSKTITESDFKLFLRNNPELYKELSK